MPRKDPEFNSYTDAQQMPPHRLMMLRRFFQDYKLLEGKAVEVEEVQSRRRCLPGDRGRPSHVTASKGVKDSASKKHTKHFRSVKSGSRVRGRFFRKKISG